MTCCSCCRSEAVGEFSVATLNGYRKRTMELCALCRRIHADIASVEEFHAIELFDEAERTPGTTA